MSDVAILIPAMRHELVGPLVDNIHATTHEPHRIYVMTNRARVADALEGKDVTVWRDRLRPWGQRLNAMYRRTTEPYLFLGADDVVFRMAWLREALREMQTVDGVVAVNDMLNTAGTLALVSRRYIDQESGCVDRPRTIIHPDYHHNFSETELFNTARSRRRFAYAVRSIVEHRHWFVTGKNDDVYERGARWWGIDEQLFDSRKHLWGG